MNGLLGIFHSALPENDRPGGAMPSGKDRQPDAPSSHYGDSIAPAAYSALSEQYRDLQVKNEQLLTENAHLKNVLNIASIGYWEIDPNHRRSRWSKTMRDILEVPPSATAETKLILNRIHPGDLSQVTEKMDGMLAGAQAGCEWCCRLRMDDGRVKWAFFRCESVMGDPGTVRLVRGTMQELPYVRGLFPYAMSSGEPLQNLMNQDLETVPDMQVAVMMALVKLAEQRDDDSYLHLERSSRYCQFVAQKLLEQAHPPEEMDEAFVENIGWASPMHDIGKVGIPDAVLLKPGSLTPKEFEIMKTHVLIGYRTLAGVDRQYPGSPVIRMAMDIALYHHERWDGTGYMQGLAGESIPLSARIVALCDVYDALRSRRVYKAPIPHAESVEIIRKERGKQFAPMLTDLFLRENEAFREIFDTNLDDTNEPGLKRT